MPRVGLSTGAVVAAATRLLDQAPHSELTLRQLADELGVKTPSLYNHVAGLDDLLRRVAMAGIAELGDRLRTAAMGRTGADAIAALATAYRGYARDHPGVYPLTQVARPGDPEYAALGQRATEPVQAVLGRAATEVIHRVRTIRSALHGFVLLEQHGGFGLDVDVDDSFEHLVRTLSAAAVEAA